MASRGIQVKLDIPSQLVEVSLGVITCAAVRVVWIGSPLLLAWKRFVKAGEILCCESFKMAFQATDSRIFVFDVGRGCLTYWSWFTISFSAPFTSSHTQQLSVLLCSLLHLTRHFELVLGFYFKHVYAHLGMCQLLLKVGDVLVA